MVEEIEVGKANSEGDNMMKEVDATIVMNEGEDTLKCLSNLCGDTREGAEGTSMLEGSGPRDRVEVAR